MDTRSVPTPSSPAAPTRPSPESATRIFLRPIATPFPLGFMAMATASLILGGSELGWFSGAEERMVAVILIAFVSPLQVLASGFGFLGRDTVAATGFGVQSGAWLVIGIDRLLSAPDHTSHVLGVFLLAASAWLLLCTLGATLGKLAPAAVLILVSVRYLLTALYQLTGAGGLEHAAGIVGVALVAPAGYVAFALELESLQRRTVLPLLRRGRGAEAMEGDLAQQVAGVDREAGVREQL
ncbi:MAG TPA: GPR1/FUN34/YaaH family transporter [Solirubrobacteraceae bacterium]|nr:GPR1/FUN34/YaaH family transporter [Solirubrobacteraceae bacterium]